jgi:multicomponent Na+:H+ antiporter subunit G|tara:strand:+ start:785 stop:1123 length:339 start_codon:yes stop_codon:yes gene_type:complete
MRNKKMDVFLNFLCWILIISGSFFVIVGAFGTYRFPDFWSRLHAASITDSAGVILLLIGMGVYSGLTLITFKLLVIGLFLFITGPTSTHAVANAALVSGLRPPKLQNNNSDG